MNGALVIRHRPAGSVGLRTAEELAGSPAAGIALPGASALTGRFMKFNQWAPVDSSSEGRFLERFAPGAFKDTIRDDRSRIRILHEHGQDALLGRRPIATLDGIGEDPGGGWFAGRMVQGTLAESELTPLLRAGLLGLSVRFQPMDVRNTDRPSASSYNPNRWPERTIVRARLAEISLTAFPVYSETSVGITPRSEPQPRLSRDEWLRWLTRSTERSR